MNTTTRPRAVIAAVAVLLVLAACSSAEQDSDEQAARAPAPTPTEETTAVIGDDEDEGQDWSEYVSMPQDRADLLVAERRAFNGGWRIFEADRWRSEEGCGCAEVEGGPELYPAGTEVALYVVEFSPRQMTMNDQARLGGQDWWTLPDVQVDANYLPSARTAVLNDSGQQVLERVNIDQITTEEIGWLPQGLTGGQALKVEPGPGDSGTVWFALAYWLDPQARDIEVTLGGIVAAEEMTEENDETWLTETLTVPLHPTGGDR
ncbi:hypothetical protein [Pseudactinotalea sp. Z1748]|uniref:hypothetical protein n=1 Tax=Pseudactinotalea sp. Z1748 TaxID=3413027 RepID=UPI003C798148